ncbi:sugar transferase [Halomonas sp. HG01]|uniref:sugar transferase n=1 Tax=Halomonas sp. HG01 TaxID=1609967 RepID=UPI001F39921E|nr:sugar transferase [Halomonas sp. HG01]
MILFPLLAALYIWVCFDSPGGAFFHQLRMGKDRKPFYILKFRSMTVKPEAESGRFDVGDASRVTRAGRMLRKFKLDELPQFMNVLRGDMSIVGPRPEIKQWVEAYPERWKTVLQVKPGITDPASIRFSNEEDVLAQYDDPVTAYRDIVLPKKLDIYEAYVSNRTLWGDLKIIFETFVKVVRG